MPKAKSRAQARFFGAVAGGKARAKGLSRREAKSRLRGVKISSLPPRVGARKK
jgi:hypothetical protein